MYASIIVAVDGSEQSMLVLDHARAIAEYFRSKLILVHAFLYTSDMTDSIEHNNIVALRTKEGESNYWTVNKKAFNQGRRIP
jgi:nucleotide-binding universal stress UspA family protein